MGAAEAIFAQLTGDTATAALIGNRVMPEPAPAGSGYPQIVYQLDDTIDSTRHYGGAGGLLHTHGELFCMAITRAAAKSLAETAQAAIDNKGGTWGGVVVLRVFARLQEDEVIRGPEQGEQRIIYEKRIDFDIWHR